MPVELKEVGQSGRSVGVGAVPALGLGYVCGWGGLLEGRRTKYPQLITRLSDGYQYVTRSRILVNVAFYGNKNDDDNDDDDDHHDHHHHHNNKLQNL